LRPLLSILVFFAVSVRKQGVAGSIPAMEDQRRTSITRALNWHNLDIHCIGCLLELEKSVFLLSPTEWHSMPNLFER